MRTKGEGWLRQKQYADGMTWLFCYQTIRPSDGKRVENSKPVGLLSEFPTEKSAWAEMGRLDLKHCLDKPLGSNPTFGELAAHYRKHELSMSGVISKRAGETTECAEHNLNKWLIPRWGNERALDITPLDLERWFEALATLPQGNKKKPLEWTTISKLKSLMSQVYKHGIRHRLLSMGVDSIPTKTARCKTKSGYEAIAITAEQMIIILNELDTPTTRMLWMLALLHAATALRPEECFGLKWSDVNWAKGLININRAWSKGQETAGKNEGSMTEVVMTSALAQQLRSWHEETLYGKNEDWVFPSLQKKGRIPRSASVAAQDYLRPAAVKAGVIPADYTGRFGWHNLRHSLATFFGANDINLPVIQSMLRHAKPSTTAKYIHKVNSAQAAAQRMFLNAIKVNPRPASDSEQPRVESRVEPDTENAVSA
jgi:integrase